LASAAFTGAARDVEPCRKEGDVGAARRTGERRGRREWSRGKGCSRRAAPSQGEPRPAEARGKEQRGEGELGMEEAASARLVEASGAGGTSGSREEERRGVEELGLFYCTRWAAGVRVLARPGGVM